MTKRSEDEDENENEFSGTPAAPAVPGQGYIRDTVAATLDSVIDLLRGGHTWQDIQQLKDLAVAMPADGFTLLALMQEWADEHTPADGGADGDSDFWGVET